MARTRDLLIGAAGAALGAYALREAQRRRSSRSKSPPRDGPRVLILGAGFAGLTVARGLSRQAPRARVLLVDRHNYHLFTPMLYQVAACAVDPYAVAFPLRQAAGHGGFAFRRGEVTGIDFSARQVHLSDGELGYDYLVVALGSTTNFFGNHAAMEHSLPLKTLEDGVAIRNHVVDRLERAVVREDKEERRSLLTFVVVGGGATGVETAAALADLVQRILPVDYPALASTRARVVVIESEGSLLGHMSDRMAAIALRRLQRIGVEVWLNTKATDVEPNRVRTDDGRELQAQTVIWATGVRVPEVVAGLEAPHGPGGSLVVDPFLQVQGRNGVYAIGDNAHFEDPQTHQAVPLLAAAAVQGGSHVARNLARALSGEPQLPFRYRSLGNVVALGHGAGVLERGGLVVDGIVGWLAWRLVHLAKITSFRNQLATALDWAYGYLYDKDTARLEVDPSRAPTTSTRTADGQ